MEHYEASALEINKELDDCKNALRAILCCLQEQVSTGAIRVKFEKAEDFAKSINHAKRLLKCKP